MLEWRDNPLFQHVDLEDSWIRAWTFDLGEHLLRFEVELSIRPGHSDYEPPAPTLHTCYRHATLVFADVQRLSGLRRMDEVVGTVERGGTDYGSFDGCAVTSKGEWTLDGDFGHVTFTCHGATLHVGDLVADV
jgi:hypothetical protein